MVPRDLRLKVGIKIPSLTSVIGSLYMWAIEDVDKAGLVGTNKESDSRVGTD